MSETRGHVGQVLYRVFRRDIGRKLIALFLAVLLFSAIDKQVTDELTYGVPIRYVDAVDLENLGESR